MGKVTAARTAEIRLFRTTARVTRDRDFRCGMTYGDRWTLSSCSAIPSTTSIEPWEVRGASVASVENEVRRYSVHVARRKGSAKYISTRVVERDCCVVEKQRSRLTIW